jgi:signal transduction histidine kinase/HAMP domain-containing protein
MPRSVLSSLYRRWGIDSLATKALLPGAALLLLTLIGGTLVFVGGSHLARRRLWERRVGAEADVVSEALARRVEAVASAGQILARDPDVARALRERSDAVWRIVNGRALVVRDQFDLAIVQIYDHRGLAQANLIPLSNGLDPPVTSSLLNMAEPGRTVARVVDDRLFLLSRTALPEEAGTVVVGIDLETELKRIRAADRLLADLGLTLRGTHVSTGAGLLSDAEDGWVHDQCYQTSSITLGATPARLIVVHPSRDVGLVSQVSGVTRATLIAVVGGTLFATLLLGGISVMVIRSVASPMRSLSAAAIAAGQGDLEQQVRLPTSRLTIGEGDELGLLTDSFNQMTDNLRAHCAHLEAKVAMCTVGLSIAADVARAVSSSLELTIILQESVQIINKRLACVCPGVHHVAVFLIEEGADVVALKEVAGEAGGNLAGKTIRVPVGSRSPVGLAVATRRSVAIQNVKVTSTHLKPPLLMETYSAVAVPLLVGDALIGALDVQSRQPDAFPSDTRQLLTTLANQIATAVHNARLYQRQCQAAEHLAEVDQLRTQFLAMMSHKLRAPLTTISGLAGSLLEGRLGPLTDGQERDVDLICSLGQHLLELTDDFLDISKMRPGTITLTLEDVDMRLLIESSLDAIAPLIEDRPVTLCAEIDQDLPIVCADKRRVRQVLLNLLSNVAAFTRAGRISVRARKIEALNVDGARMEPFIEVCIAETGPGISTERLPGDLRALARPDVCQASEYVAAGFGFPITQALLDLHGGRIWADSKSDGGTTFTFILPVDQLDADEIQPPERTRADSVEVAAHGLV